MEGSGSLPASAGSRNRIFLESLLLPEAPERNTSSFFLGISIRSGPRLAKRVLLGAVVWANGQLALVQHGRGPLRSPGGLRGWRAAGISGQLGT